MPTYRTVKLIRISLSCTEDDLAQYRSEASRIISEIAQDVRDHCALVQVSSDEEERGSESSISRRMRLIAESDWLVLVVGWNYGEVSGETQPPGLSDTEWGYRQFRAEMFRAEMENASGRRRLFVFMPGEPNTSHAYRSSRGGGEEVDLKDWIDRQGVEEKRRLHAFRNELSRNHQVHVFADLGDFRERLEQLLRATIVDECRSDVHGASLSKGQTLLRQTIQPPRPTQIESGSDSAVDIFLSYAREDLGRAKKLAAALTECGWSVWWDRRMPAGVNVRREIDRKLNAAKCVVVLWSSASIDADWVVDEADHGKEREVLVQVLIDPVRPPRGFRQQNYADLTEWNGEGESDGYVMLKMGISRLVSGS